MDDLDKYIEKRKHKNPEFAASFESGFENFKIGILLRQAREETGMTQEQIAELLVRKQKNQPSQELKIMQKI